MRNKILTAIALVTTVAAGAFAGYRIATDDELRGRLLRSAQDIADTVDTFPELPILEVGPGMGGYDRRCCHAYCSGNEESQD